MRIATWNLERGGRTIAVHAAQEAKLREIAADVVVLTEPPAAYRTGPGVVASPAKRAGRRGFESWVAITGECVEPVALDVPYERLAVAALARIAGRTMLTYGAVLPWLSVVSHAPDLVNAGESALDVFKRVLAAQVADVAELQRRYGDIVIWAGDFNQTVTGPNRGGSTIRRQLLLEALRELDLAAWNGAADHARSGLCAIDLICGPCSITPTRQARFDPVHREAVLSDHAGYWVGV